MTDLAANIAQRCFYHRAGGKCAFGGGGGDPCRLCPNWWTSKGGPEDPHTWFDLAPDVRGRGLMPRTGVQGIFHIDHDATTRPARPQSLSGLAAWDGSGGGTDSGVGTLAAEPGGMCTSHPSNPGVPETAVPVEAGGGGEGVHGPGGDLRAAPSGFHSSAGSEPMKQSAPANPAPPPPKRDLDEVRHRCAACSQQIVCAAQVEGRPCKGAPPFGDECSRCFKGRTGGMG